MSTFRKHCSKYLSDSTATVFYREICIVFCGFMQEIRFQQGCLQSDLENYMRIRTQTIGVAPFFALIRGDAFPHDGNPDDVLAMQTAVNTAIGLQNDLIGLEKDIRVGESMNAVLITMANSLRKGEEKGIDLADAITAICVLHNSTIAEMAKIHQKILQGAKAESEIAFANSQLVFIETHFKWCTTAKRYELC